MPVMYTRRDTTVRNTGRDPLETLPALRADHALSPVGKLPLSADHAMMDSSVATREESPCANRASRRVRSSPS